jgi:hypothetical protein
MRKYLFNLVMIVAMLWLALGLIRTENQRYALSLGMCFDRATNITSYQCLAAVKTRTAWWWHLYYGLQN